jgi:hypothetical protein
MTTQHATKILVMSVSDYVERHSSINIIEAIEEIANLANLEILKIEKKVTFGHNSIHPIDVFMKVLLPITKAFQEAAFEVWPQEFTAGHAITLGDMIRENTANSDLENYLRNYFRKKHNREISEI